MNKNIIYHKIVELNDNNKISNKHRFEVKFRTQHVNNSQRSKTQINKKDNYLMRYIWPRSMV